MVDLSPTSLIVAHYSMKFSYQASRPWMGGLTKLQSQHDVDTFYARAVHKGYAWATGTEAGQNPLQRQLRKGAKANGYRFYVRKGNWIVVRKDRIKRFSWSKGHCFVAHKDETLGPGQDSEFGWGLLL